LHSGEGKKGGGLLLARQGGGGEVAKATLGGG
jgi:hypothetical protein